MKVILQEDVAGQGKKGDLVEVSEGYARNYLLPRKLAEKATPDALNAYKQREKARRDGAARAQERARTLAEQMKDMVVRVHAKAGSQGRLFGAVTAAHVAEALKAQYRLEIDKHKLVLEEPIKQYGRHEIKVKLGSEISARIQVEVGE
ncbi:MAG: 50S ribosomal protein L9 [Oscillospiraceae bacterium]|jgi:large subunit ribosomal protein L9|nr:50S ribosomal protein L9 [Oscillospiraceae bacterium]